MGKIHEIISKKIIIDTVKTKELNAGGDWVKINQPITRFVVVSMMLLLAEKLQEMLSTSVLIG